MALTQQKKKFADRYFETLKGSESAIYAGFSERTAKQIAWNILQEPEVEEYLSKLRLEAEEKHGITKEKWLNELSELGFSNIQDFMNAGNNFKDIASIDRDRARSISSVKKSVTEFEGGEKTVVEFKLHDKLSALEKIGRHFGYYEKDNDQKKDVIQINIGNDDAKLGE